VTEYAFANSSWLASLVFSDSKDQPPQSGGVDESALYFVLPIPPNERAILAKSRDPDSAEERF
jgi:hypothetical protein